MGDPAECSGPLQLPANGRRPGKVDEEYHVRSNGSYRCLIGLALLANNAPLRACEICEYIRLADRERETLDRIANVDFIGSLLNLHANYPTTGGIACPAMIPLLQLTC